MATIRERIRNWKKENPEKAEYGDCQEAPLGT